MVPATFKIPIRSYPHPLKTYPGLQSKRHQHPYYYHWRTDPFVLPFGKGVEPLSSGWDLNTLLYIRSLYSFQIFKAYNTATTSKKNKGLKRVCDRALDGDLKFSPSVANLILIMGFILIWHFYILGKNTFLIFPSSPTWIVGPGADRFV